MSKIDDQIGNADKMESFESKRIAGQEEDNLLEKETKNEHQTSLFHLGSTEYITPISFEDGMDWRECEMYYTALYEGMIDLRSSVHIRRTSKIRKPSKMQLQQQASGIKPSCLRSQTTKHKPLRPPMRRSVSFNTLPKDNALYASHLGDTMQDLFKEPRVNFDDYVSVMTILPRQDYPLDVRNDIWMSKDESEKCLCDAMTERSCQNASSAPIKHNVESIDSGNASVKLTVGLDQDLSLISFQ